MVFGYSSYREYLGAELGRRIQCNPRYSLRAMARDIGVSPAQLSLVIRGQKNLSQQSAFRIANKLTMKPRESDYFCLLVEYETAKTEEKKRSILKKLQVIHSTRSVRDLSADAFKVISDWYHIPIIEMTELDDFEFNAESVSERLGITPFEATTAILRLERLDLIKLDETGNYKKKHLDTIVKAPNSHIALRNLHRQMLAKAVTALEEQDPSKRFVGSETLSIDVSQIPDAKRMLSEFLNRMVMFFSEGTKKTETYHLSLQFFGLTLKKEKPKMVDFKEPVQPQTEIMQ